MVFDTKDLEDLLKPKTKQSKSKKQIDKTISEEINLSNDFCESTDDFLYSFLETNTLPSLIQKYGEAIALKEQTKEESWKNQAKQLGLTLFNGFMFSNNAIVITKERMITFAKFLFLDDSNREEKESLLLALNENFVDTIKGKIVNVRASVNGKARNYYSDLAEQHAETVILRIFGNNSSLDGLFIREFCKYVNKGSTVVFLGKESRLGRDEGIKSFYYLMTGIKDCKTFFMDVRAKNNLTKDEYDKLDTATKGGKVENFITYFKLVTSTDWETKLLDKQNRPKNTALYHNLLTLCQGVLYNGTVTEFLCYLLKIARDKHLAEGNWSKHKKRVMKLIVGTNYQKALSKYCKY